jgi:hypothetical protein
LANSSSLKFLFLNIPGCDSILPPSCKQAIHLGQLNYTQK